MISCLLQVIKNCLEIFRSVNTVLIINAFHATTMLLHSDPPIGHEFLLPICKHELHRCSFVVHCLFNYLTD